MLVDVVGGGEAGLCPRLRSVLSWSMLSMPVCITCKVEPDWTDRPHNTHTNIAAHTTVNTANTGIPIIYLYYFYNYYYY